MRRCLGGFGCGVLTLALVVTSGLRTTGAEKSAGDLKGKPANLNFTLKDMNGMDVSLNAYKGKVILLDFWATWCGPCRIEIPGFVELYTKYASQGFVALGVSVDDPASKLQPYAKQFKINYPVLLGLDRDDIKNAYGPLVGFPTSFLIGRDGKVSQKHVGYTPREEFEREIKSLLQ